MWQTLGISGKILIVDQDFSESRNIVGALETGVKD